MTPKFERYSLEELYEALETIDRFKYPDRLRELELLIQHRVEEYRTGGFVNAGEARARGRLSILSRRLSSSTVFKLVFFALLVMFVGLSVFASIAVGLGAPLMNLNGEVTTGLQGAAMMLGFGLVVSLVGSLLLSLLTCLGAWLFSRVSDVKVELLMEGRDAAESQQG